MTYKIFGNPVAQGRPRFFRRGNFVGTYDPDKSRSWKDTIISQIVEQNPEYHAGAIAMTINFAMPRPKSLPKKVKHHIKRPDLDNLIKAVKDALHGICFKDDSQIVSLIAEKHYAEDQTGIMITITPQEVNNV